ncbi:MAG: ribonuclease HII [Asgard group archaeon]|nr:ribonuclease HII [Asgard group archaeon]
MVDDFMEKKRRIVVGADEAGRGLIIGPMVIGACAVDDSVKQKFERIGIKDSKNYSSHSKIKAHAELIKKESLAWSIKSLSAEVLTNYNKNEMSMDEAEAYAFFRAIEDIAKKIPDIAEYQVDNFQAVSKLRSLLKTNKSTSNIKLIVTPRAEKEFIAVGAGSVLARNASLEELKNIRAKYGDFGSGSTNDKKTINWLKQYYKNNRSWPKKIVRVYWKTIERLENEQK